MLPIALITKIAAVCSLTYPTAEPSGRRFCFKQVATCYYMSGALQENKTDLRTDLKPKQMNEAIAAGDVCLQGYIDTWLKSK